MSLIPMSVGGVIVDVVSTGSVDVTIGSDGGAQSGYSLLPSYGSIANNTLITVNGVAPSISAIRTSAAGPNNTFDITFATSAAAGSALAHIQATFTTVGSASWSVPTSEIAQVSTTLRVITTSGLHWDAGDVGNTETVGWS